MNNRTATVTVAINSPELLTLLRSECGTWLDRHFTRWANPGNDWCAPTWQVSHDFYVCEDDDESLGLIYHVTYRPADSWDYPAHVATFTGVLDPEELVQNVAGLVDKCVANSVVPSP